MCIYVADATTGRITDSYVRHSPRATIRFVYVVTGQPRLALDLEFGVKLREARRAAGFTQAQLAIAAAVAQATISRIETARESPPLATCEKLIGALGQQMILLFGSDAETTALTTLIATIKGGAATT